MIYVKDATKYLGLWIYREFDTEARKVQYRVVWDKDTVSVYETLKAAKGAVDIQLLSGSIIL